MKPTDGRAYYHNHASGRSVWALHAGAPVPVPVPVEPSLEPAQPAEPAQLAITSGAGTVTGGAGRIG